MRPGIFKHPCVRDLAWAGFAPPMILGPDISGAGIDYSPFWREHLQALDADPAPLLAFLGDACEKRLGIYYERLWHYLLERDPDTELLAHNLPVRDGKRTIGEFDCLFWCRRRNAHIHLELAVKFYLGIPGQDSWLGPGARDRLDIKLDHLLDQQSRLASHPAARQPLQALGIADCLGLIDIKGYLFVPACGMQAPRWHNAANALQRWYSLEEFCALEPLSRSWVGWQEIPRRRWLSPFVAAKSTAQASESLMAALADRLETRGRPVQLAACDQQGVEKHRCFVAPTGWPG
jgi:hypothetical protein